MQSSHIKKQEDLRQMKQVKAEVLKILNTLHKPTKTDVGDTYITVTIANKDKFRKFGGKVCPCAQ